MEDLTSQCITVLSLSPNLVGVKEAALEVKRADPGFLERGLICIKMWGGGGRCLLISSHFS